MIWCCGQELVTDFCPCCGKPRRATMPIEELLEYSRSRVLGHELAFKREQGFVRNAPECVTKQVLCELARQERLLKQWQRWTQAIVDLLALVEAPIPKGTTP